MKKNTKKNEALTSTMRLKALMNALPVGITFSTDATCKYITGNPYLLRQLEMISGDNISADAIDDNNIAGKKLRHFINGKQITGVEMPMQRAIAENRLVGPLEIEVELPSGKRWLMEATGAPIHDERGKVVASVAVNIDLTERKKAEYAEKIEMQMVEEKQKIEFIADATHELRTPLSIIKGNIDLVLGGDTRDRRSVEESLVSINEEIVHLEKLLSDLTLLTSKDSAGKAKPNYQKIDIQDLMTKTIKRHQSFAKKTNVSISMLALPKFIVEGDERYLERLFSNLISNAILYSKKDGRISISGKKIDDKVRIDVRDDGIGISKTDLPHIFDRFYRTQSSRSVYIGGTGLGLAIVKWITESHGGSIEVKSRENEGSVFRVTLPRVQ